ncbi:UvrD-helicase domain-containing protein [Candidatus Poriferisodalis sp.]|uniref:UvrD-helicase domain-containing protein n=1 Tax=Candidatus Poriferisodalis sp. TaxID=3101277 RepID=UPI003B01929D
MPSDRRSPAVLPDPAALTSNAAPAGNAVLPDQAERDLIAADANSLLFVEAGAGTGKTTALVDRIVSMVTGAGSFEPVPMSAIAAITFTDKAAAELRNRVRAELNKALGTASRDQHGLVRAALSELDGAAVGTLHSFARRILAEHPVEAGLPPSFETLDEIASEVAFDERWDLFFCDLMSDESMRWPVGMLDAVGIGPGHVRDLARVLNANSDRLGWPPHAARDTPLEVSRIEKLARQLAERRSECFKPAGCKLHASFGPISALVRHLGNARNDRERLRVLTRANIPKVANKGKKDDWPDVAAVRDGFAALAEAIDTSAGAAVAEALAQVVERLRGFTVNSAEHRRRMGSLEFHDLLTQARWLLRDSPAAGDVRAALAAQYQRLMLDEFQDTDPIQIELAQLIAFPDGISTNRTNTGSARPERLFFVGDPKQSIYRFRRADIAQYQAAQSTFGEQLGSVIALRTNFRTLPGIVAWVNEVFGRLITEVAGLQPPYRALSAGRRLPAADLTAADLAAEPRVGIVGLLPHPRKMPISEVREAESADVARVIQTILSQPWTVIDPRTNQARPARANDIAVLIPKRTGLSQLEDALTDADISFRLEAASFVWRTQMVRDLMMCLRAVSDPTDALATASALRTPVYGCGDDDLYLHRRHHHGSWNCTDPRLNDAQPTPVVEALRHLLSLHQRSAVLGPAALLDALVRERRLYEQVATRARPRDGWRQIRYLIDQARAWSDSQHGGLRGFLAWARGQASENSRITESILPESDDEAVRVMTIHAAKGLEFPMVIVAGLQDKPRKRAGVQAIFASEGSPPDMSPELRPPEMTSPKTQPPEIRLSGTVNSLGFDNRNDEELEALHYERLRLLYVACTRARDHLIVSVHRKEPPKSTRESHNMESGELLFAALEADDGSVPGDLRQGRTWQAFEHLAGNHRAGTQADSHAGITETGTNVGGTTDSRAHGRAGSTEADAGAPSADDTPVTGVLTRTPGSRFENREEWLRCHAAAGGASRTVSHLSASGLARHHATTAAADAAGGAAANTEAGNSVGHADHSPDRAGPRHLAAPAGGRPSPDRPGLGGGLDAAGLSKDDASAGVHAGARTAVGDAGDTCGFSADGVPPVRRGRYGTALGSAVHAVLQSIDIAGSSSHHTEMLRTLVDVCARDHGVPKQASEITRRVRAALGSETLAEAARGRYWQEVFVSAALPDGLVLEGFIDLLYETPQGGLVVVDFKTDALDDHLSVEHKTRYYRLQGATYAWCAQQATGAAVERIVFQFLSPGGLREGVIEGDDLATALDEVPTSARSARSAATRLVRG